MLRSPTRWNDTFTRILEQGARRSAEQRRNAVVTTLQDSEGAEAAPTPAKTSPPRLWPYPGATRVLDRPYANISGKRHVPKLVNANRVPILRFKKPQSPFLSRIIRDTVKTREARLSLCVKLHDLLRYAHDEDEWDRILSKQVKIRQKNPEEHWSSETQRALNDVVSLQTAAGNKRVAIAAQMQAIIEKEKELAMEEKSRIQNEKYMVRKAKYFSSIRQEMPAPEEQPLAEDTAAKKEQPLTERTIAKMKLKEEIGRTHGETQSVSCTDEERAAIKAERKKRKEEQAKVKEAKLKRRDEQVEYWQQKLNNDASVASKSNNIPSGFAWRQVDNERRQRNPRASILVGLRQQSREEAGLPRHQRLPAKAKTRRIPLLNNSTKAAKLKKRDEQVNY